MKIQTWTNIILFAFVGILIGVNLRNHKENEDCSPKIKINIYFYVVK